MVIVKHPGHFTSMKNDLGAGTSVFYKGQDQSAQQDARALEPTSYLQLVLPGLRSWRRIEEIDGENLYRQGQQRSWSAYS